MCSVKYGLRKQCHKPRQNSHMLSLVCLVVGVKEVNATGRSFTVWSTIHLQVNRKDDGAAYTCSVEHIALNGTPQQVTEVLEVYCK